MPNLTRRARRRRRAILADQLNVALATARVRSTSARSVRTAGDTPVAPVEPPLAAPAPSGLVPGLVPVLVSGGPRLRQLPTPWLAASAALGHTRASRPARAQPVRALPAGRRGWPDRLEAIAEELGLAIDGWREGRCRLYDGHVGSVTVTVEPEQHGWERQVFDPSTPGHDGLDITDELPDLWFGDLFERVEGIGEAAVWVTMSRTLRLQASGWRITVELDIDLGESAGDVELATAVARAVINERIPGLDPAADRRHRFRRRR